MILEQQLVQNSVIGVEDNKKDDRHHRGAENRGQIINRPQQGTSL